MTPPFPAAAIEAVRDAVKAHLRTDGGEDALIETHAAAAMALAEAFTGASLVGRAFAQDVPRDGRWHRLTMGPVTTISAGTDAAIDIGAFGDGWVRAAAGEGAVSVAYTAGLAADWAGVPAPVAQGVALLAAHLFDNRPASAAPPAAVAALWRPYRRMRLAGAERAA